jgi:hypothetical protein
MQAKSQYTVPDLGILPLLQQYRVCTGQKLGIAEWTHHYLQICHWTQSAWRSRWSSVGAGVKMEVKTGVKVGMKLGVKLQVKSEVKLEVKSGVKSLILRVKSGAMVPVRME